MLRASCVSCFVLRTELRACFGRCSCYALGALRFMPLHASSMLRASCFVLCASCGVSCVPRAVRRISCFLRRLVLRASSVLCAVRFVRRASFGPKDKDETRASFSVPRAFRFVLRAPCAVRCFVVSHIVLHTLCAVSASTPFLCKKRPMIHMRVHEGTVNIVV